MLNMLVYSLGVYLAAGLVCGGLLILRGLGRIDRATAGTSIWFKLIILPGLSVFWPVFLLRFIRGVEEPPEERNAHRGGLS